MAFGFTDPTYWSPILAAVFNFNSVSPYVKCCRDRLCNTGKVDGPHSVVYIHPWNFVPTFVPLVFHKCIVSGKCVCSPVRKALRISIFWCMAFF